MAGMRARAAAAGVVGALLASCATVAPPEDAAGAAEPAAVEAAFAEVRAYVEGFAGADFRRMASVSTGPARLYADYRVAGLRAGVDPEPPQADLTLTEPSASMLRTDAGLELTAEASMEFPDGQVVVFDRFVTRTQAGRWNVEAYHRDGLPLTSYLVAGDAQPTTAGPVGVALVVAYRDPGTGALAVVLAITAGAAEGVDLPAYRARFTAASSGRGYPVGGSAGQA